MSRKQLEKSIERTKKLMQEAAKKLDFIEAAQYRDEVLKMEELLKRKRRVRNFTSFPQTILLSFCYSMKQSINHKNKSEMNKPIKTIAVALAAIAAMNVQQTEACYRAPPTSVLTIQSLRDVRWTGKKTL